MDYKKIRNCIKQQIDSGCSNFIIWPFGYQGLNVKQILNQCFGIQERLIIDNELCNYNPDIKSMDYLISNKKSYSDCKILVTLEEVEKLGIENLDIEKEKFVIIFEKSSATKGDNVGRFSYGPLTEPNHRLEKIGAFCSFALGCDVVWNHPLNMVTNHEFIYNNDSCKEIDCQKYKIEDFNKKFVIGNDVWFGRNVILTNGVKIGNGVRVAAGAVVTKDLPDYAIAAGVPAKIIGYRFSQEQIQKLNEIKWWEWSIDKIKECYDDFRDINVFLEKHYNEKKD